MRDPVHQLDRISLGHPVDSIVHIQPADRRGGGLNYCYLRTLGRKLHACISESCASGGGCFPLRSRAIMLDFFLPEIWGFPTV